MRRLPAPCLVVLAGPAGPGKSTRAAAHFPPDQVVSSDRLRAVVGSGEDDIAASADALAPADGIVARQVVRGLTTVVDATALDPGARAARRALARTAGVPCVAVAFATPAAVCRARNRAAPPRPRRGAGSASSPRRGWPRWRCASRA